MPLLFEMTWVDSRATWSKIYLGCQYLISCRQLRALGYDAPNTKLGSRAAANQWWAEKRHEIDYQNIVLAHDTGRALKSIVPQRSRSLVGNVELGAFMRSSSFAEDEQGNLYRNQRL